MDKFMWWVLDSGEAISVEVTGQCKNGSIGVRVCGSNVYHLVVEDELQKDHPYW